MGAVAEEWDVRSKRKLDHFLYDFLNTKNRYTTSRPLKMKFRNFKMVG
jgi:hypothetical protein